MRFLDRLRRFFSPQPNLPRLDVLVRCNRCGEIIRTQIDLRNDLSVRYEGASTGYYYRKGLVGSGRNRCFQRIVVEYAFDAEKNAIDRSVEGGSFVLQEGQGQ
jgi:hypothetical protein